MRVTRVVLVAGLVVGCASIPADTQPPQTPSPVSTSTAAATAFATQSPTPTTVEVTPVATTVVPAAPTATPDPTAAATAEQPPTEPPPPQTPSPTPHAIPMFMSPVWEDPGGGTFERVASFLGTDGRYAIAVGRSTDGAMAWTSSNGFDWDRILKPNNASEVTGVTADGVGRPVMVGDRDYIDPLVWEPRRGGGFSLVELPKPDGRETTANQVAHGYDSFLAIGSAFPNGIEGDANPVAWLKTEAVDDAPWTLIEAPADALEFVDVTNSSVFGDGVVTSARMFGERFVGDRYTVLGYTERFRPAVWYFTPEDGKWERTVLPGSDELLQHMVDSRLAVGSENVWMMDGGDWTNTSQPTEGIASFEDVVRLDTGDVDAGLFLGGVWSDDTVDAYFMVFKHSLDGTNWTDVPERAEGHIEDLIDSLTALDGRVIGISEDFVYMGAFPSE